MPWMDFIHGTAFFLSTRFARRGPEKEVGELSALLIDIRLHAVYGKITVAVTEGAIGQKNKEKWKEQQDAKNNERRFIWPPPCFNLPLKTAVFKGKGP